MGERVFLTVMYQALGNSYLILPAGKVDIFYFTGDLKEVKNLAQGQSHR